jgi:anti-anti-sigma factor
MQLQQFDARVRHQNGVAVIDLHGEINGLAEGALEHAYTEATQADPLRLLLNFSEATYINSTGLALIVGVLARARKQHRDVAAFGLSEHYREIFEITRLADFMSIVADEASATIAPPSRERGHQQEARF